MIAVAVKSAASSKGRRSDVRRDDSRPFGETDLNIAAFKSAPRAMSAYGLNPPLTLKGDIVVHNLDDAVRFMTGLVGRAGVSLHSSR